MIPAVEVRKVARVPGLAEPGRAQVPIWSDLTRCVPQVVPEVVQRRSPPVPVAVVQAVNDQAGLQHECVRNHRVVFGVRIFLNVEVFLNNSARVRQKRPMRANGRGS